MIGIFFMICVVFFGFEATSFRVTIRSLNHLLTHQILHNSPNEDLNVTIKNNHRFATRAVHAGSEPEYNSWSVIPPISLSTSFTQPFPGVKPGLDDPNSHGTGYYYSRQANPTRYWDIFYIDFYFPGDH